jgi:hypothetical protein
VSFERRGVFNETLDQFLNNLFVPFLIPQIVGGGEFVDT